VNNNNSDEEGTFLIVDTDKIAHGILLPPAVLRAISSAEESGGGGLVCLDDSLSHHGGGIDPTEESGKDLSVSSSVAATDNMRGSGASRSSSVSFTAAGQQAATAAAAAAMAALQSSNSPSPYMVRPSDSVYDKVLEAFGSYDIMVEDRNNGGVGLLIDRTKLGAVVFPDRELRRRLNRISHPKILICLFTQLLRGIFTTHADVVCADIPLLFESGMLRYLFAVTIVVAADPDIQLKRLRSRNPELSEQQCQDRINSQMPIGEKAKMGDVVIWNNGDDLEGLEQEVEQARREVMGRIYGIGMSLLQMLLLVGGSLSLAVSSKLFSSWS